MGLKSVTELPATGNVGQDGHRTYTRKFIVEFDSKLDGPVSAMAAVGISYKSNFVSGGDYDTFAKCISLDADELADYFYTVTAEYTTNLLPSQQYENPMDAPPQAFVGRVHFNIPEDRTWDNQPIVNKAKDKFIPPIEREVCNTILRIVRNEASFDLAASEEWEDAVNEGEFMGGAPKTWRAKPPVGNTAVAMVDGEQVVYWVVEYEFERNPATWTKKLYNTGYRKIEGGERVEIKDKYGEKLSEPVALSNDGTTVLGPDVNPIELSFEIYTPRDFSVFGLTLENCKLDGTEWE